MSVHTRMFNGLFCVMAAGAVALCLSCGKKVPAVAQKSTTTPVAAVATPVARPSITTVVTGDTLITVSQQDTLLAIARRSIAHFLNTGSTTPLPVNPDTFLYRPRGCLIRLTVNGNPRGSSGYIMPVKGIGDAVAELALLAATGGNQSSALKRDEFDSTVISITIVSEPNVIFDESGIKIGKHGLVMIKEGEVDGIVLPQEIVRLESADAAVSRLLTAANMTRNDWKNKAVSINTFTLQIFQEKM